MKKSQNQWILSQLQRYGKIRRNQCLKRYISRLAARISDLKEAGYKIEGHRVKTKMGRDYQYNLVK